LIFSVVVGGLSKNGPVHSFFFIYGVVLISRLGFWLGFSFVFVEHVYIYILRSCCDMFFVFIGFRYGDFLVFFDYM
ncbi:hypothetical protein ACQWF5_25165, partial [Salmonella enterica subsp. enterica serovar Infantis]